MLGTSARGKITLVAVCAAFIYYTLWVLVTPFVDDDQAVLKLFPDTYYAIAIPVYAGVLLFSATLVKLGSLLVRDELNKLRGRSSKPKAS